jgi:type II secretory pathway pseudopilin PulG
MVEIIVVVVILGVLAGLMVPRVISTSGREARRAAEAAAEVLSAAARRDSLSTQRVAIDFDGSLGTLKLVKMGTNARGEASWVDDQLAPRAEMGSAIVTSALSDALTLDAAGQFRVEFPVMGRRPDLTFVIEDSRRRETYRVVLSSSAVRARVVMPGQSTEASAVVDLDAQGKGEQAW